MTKVFDSVEVLVSKISHAIREIKGLSMKKDELHRKMQRSADRQDRIGLVQLLAEAREIGNRQKAMTPAWKLWDQALTASKKFVHDQNRAGHQGQLLFNMALREQYAKVQDRLTVGYPLSSEDGLDALLSEINMLITTVENYQWSGNFCSCGRPIDKDHWRCTNCIAKNNHRSLKEESRSNRERQHEYARPR